MRDVAFVIFAVSLAMCLYVYAGYPTLVVLLARLRPRPVRRSSVTPSMSVIIAAHCEGSVIERKIYDILNNGYPHDQLQVIVASDGSTDDTETAVRRVDHPRVLLLSLPRKGKLRTLISGAEAASGDLLVFTDADSVILPGSLRSLAENFADPEVGGVAGRKILAREGSQQPVGRGESLYVRFDEWLKQQESCVGSVISSHGALHAIRRFLFDPGNDPAASDDMAISIRVATQGYRLVFEPRAGAIVSPPSRSSAELRRKVRIANRATRALVGLGPALWVSGLHSFQLISHKLLRYMVPFFLILIWTSNLALALLEGGPWAVLLGLQVVFYGLAWLGASAPRRSGKRSPLLAIPHYFCLANLAALIALVSVMRGVRVKAWSPGSGDGPEIL